MPSSQSRTDGWSNRLNDWSRTRLLIHTIASPLPPHSAFLFEVSISPDTELRPNNWNRCFAHGWSIPRSCQLLRASLFPQRNVSRKDAINLTEVKPFNRIISVDKQPIASIATRNALFDMAMLSLFKLRRRRIGRLMGPRCAVPFRRIRRCSRRARCLDLSVHIRIMGFSSSTPQCRHPSQSIRPDRQQASSAEPWNNRAMTQRSARRSLDTPIPSLTGRQSANASCVLSPHDTVSQFGNVKCDISTPTSLWISVWIVVAKRMFLQSLIKTTPPVSRGGLYHCDRSAQWDDVSVEAQYHHRYAARLNTRLGWFDTNSTLTVAPAGCIFNRVINQIRNLAMPQLVFVLAKLVGSYRYQTQAYVRALPLKGSYFFLRTSSIAGTLTLCIQLMHWRCFNFRKRERWLTNCSFDSIAQSFTPCLCLAFHIGPTIMSGSSVISR